MERQTTHPMTKDTAFGYRIFHKSSSSRSETPVDPQGHIRRAVVPQSKCIKEVPNLENVSAFLSDPLNVEEDAAPTSSLQVPGRPIGSGEECSEDWIDDFDPAKVLKQVNRTLSSAWKFNPYFGANPGAMGPFPKDLELTLDEFNFANNKKIIKDTANETRIRADNARGKFELRNINKRNKKNLNIAPWPEDISFLNDKAFAEQVNLNAFCSRSSIPNGVHSGLHDIRDNIPHDHRQGVFKDSAIHMEDEFHKEAIKGSPTSSIRPKHERNEGAVTGSFLAPSPDEVGCEPSVPSELHQVLSHNTSDAAGLGTLVHARLGRVSVQTSLALFDHSDATLGGQYDGPPYDIRDLAKSSTLDRAIEDTLYLPFDTRHGHELPPTDTVHMGMSGGASLKTEEHERPFSALGMPYEPLGRAVGGHMNDINGRETPLAPPSPPFASFNSPGQRELASPDAFPEVHEWSAPSTENSFPYKFPTPTGFASPSPTAFLQASNAPDDNASEGRTEVFSAPATANQASPRSLEAEATLREAKVYYHDNGPYSAPTPMYPISVPLGQTTDVANVYNVHTPNDSIYAPTPMIPEFFSPDAATEVLNAGGNFSHDVTDRHFADYDNSEPLPSASRPVPQNFYAAANGTANANGIQSPIAPAGVLTRMGHDEPYHDEYDFTHGYLPATNRSATPYQSPYHNLSVEGGNRPNQDVQAPVIHRHRRPTHGGLRLPGYTAGAPIIMPNAGVPIPNPNAIGPIIAMPSSGAPIPMPNSGAPATRPNHLPSPYDDAPAFSTRSRSRSRASSAASAATAARAATPDAASGDDFVASSDTKTTNARTPRRKNQSETKAPRRKSTPKAKPRSATPAAGKSGGRGRARSVRDAQEGQPPSKRGRTRKRRDSDGSGLA